MPRRAPHSLPTDGALRVGDRERADAADRLSAHAAAGRLSVEELEERLERAGRAVFVRDLLATEADLPAPRSRAPRRPRRPAFAIACLVAAVLMTVVIGHPIVPLFLAAALLWRAGHRPPRLRGATP